MTPPETPEARQAMDDYLHRRGVRHRPIELIDNLIRLFRSLGDHT